MAKGMGMGKMSKMASGPPMGKKPGKGLQTPDPMASMKSFGKTLMKGKGKKGK